MTQRYLPPRNTQLWLLLSLTLAMAPLLWELPLWIAGVWAWVVLWRWKIFHGRWAMPPTPVKSCMVGACALGLWLSFGRFKGLEPMSTLLVLALLLKWLEQQRRRDTLIVAYLGFLLIALQFLFSQSFLTAFYGLVCVWLLITSLISLYQPQGNHKPARTARLSARLLLHSVPLMLLIFFVAPRVGSLWAVPTLKHAAQTGVSDSMSPGDFSNLSKAGGVAFRVRFDGEPPPRHLLYWRGLVFDHFDGRSWKPSQRSLRNISEPVVWDKLPQEQQQPNWLSRRKLLSEPIKYDIIMDASHQRWLYSLPMVSGFELHGSLPDQQIGVHLSQGMMARRPLSERMRYSVSSSLSYYYNGRGLTKQERALQTQLPVGVNPQSRAIATQWRAEVTSDNDYMQRLLDLYRQSFIYTLQPPLLGKHSVDEFLWRDIAAGGQQGFCEHFASSFVFMMRAADIPARVVVGYMGGEYNDAERYLLVHQYDAHAWAEVWLPDQGWVRVDPTAAVAPERIESSLGDLQANEVHGVLSLGRYRHLLLLNDLRKRWDALNYRWHRHVMGFDRQQQSNILNRWLGGVSPLKLMLLILGVGTATLALVSLQLWWRNRPKPASPLDRYFHRFERLLARHQLQRLPGEGPATFASRAGQSLPHASGDIERFVRLYQRSAYRPQSSSSLKPLRIALHNLRRQL